MQENIILLLLFFLFLIIIDLIILRKFGERRIIRFIHDNRRNITNRRRRPIIPFNFESQNLILLFFISEINLLYKL